MAQQNWTKRFGSAPAIPFASLSPAAGNAGLIVAVSDFDDALFQSNGTRWRPLNGHVVLAQSAVPVGKAPSGSVAANGALTLGTATTEVFSGGIWWLLPAGAAYAGSAQGVYWCVMSSTTVGTIYDTTYDVTTELPYIPASPTPIVAAGPGAYTGLTGNRIVLGTKVPGNAMGIEGLVRAGFKIASNNTAGTKDNTLMINGSTASWSTTLSGANVYNSTQVSLQNIGVVNQQIISRSNATEYFGAMSGIVVRKTYDTTTDMLVQFALNAIATDWALIEAIEFVLQA